MDGKAGVLSLRNLFDHLEKPFLIGLEVSETSDGNGEEPGSISSINHFV